MNSNNRVVRTPYRRPHTRAMEHGKEDPNVYDIG